MPKCMNFEIKCKLEIKETFEPQHDKTDKMTVRPEKPQISLSIW